jgi:hypothetical protein
VLIDLRKFSFEDNPIKVKQMLVSKEAGFIKPKCEAIAENE